MLCGGRATRLGEPKESLPFGDGTLLEFVLNRLSPMFAPTLIVGLPPHAPSPPGATSIPDDIPGSGPLGGIYSGLLHCGTEHAFVFACDAPFISQSLARHIMTLAPGADVVVPVQDSHFHPLFALYARSCLPVIQEHLNRRKFKISDIYPELTVRTVDESVQRRHDPDLRCFLNINTRGDYENALSILHNEKELTAHDV